MDSLNKFIHRINISTQLAQDAQTTEVSLPEWCKDFEDVFSEKTYNLLPPHCPYDHTIDLKPSFTPKTTKVYPLNPKENEACCAFIDENLTQNHPKQHHSSLFLRRMVSFALSRLLLPKLPHHLQHLSTTPHP